MQQLRLGLSQRRRPHGHVFATSKPLPSQRHKNGDGEGQARSGHGWELCDPTSSSAARETTRAQGMRPTTCHCTVLILHRESVGPRTLVMRLRDVVGF